MAIKNIVASGIGFSPGSVKFIITRGLSIGAALVGLDPVTNFAKVTVRRGYNAAATTIELEPGDGAKLPDPAIDGAFNFVWWNAENYPDPTGDFTTFGDPNIEIGRCTSRTGDFLTVLRAQEGTAATDKNIATKTYQIFLGATKKTIDDISTHIVDSSMHFTVGSIDHGSIGGLGGDDHGAVYGGLAQTETITGAWTFSPHGDGGLTNYDILIGNGSPTYGMARIGNSAIGRTSFKAGNIDLDGAILYRNIGGPVTGQIEHIFTESTGNTCRFAIPKSAVGNATYNSRSMLIAGPAPANTDFVTVGYWQTNNNIFHNLACDTSGSGSDLGVQNDLEVEGDIFTDSIKESTPEAGISIANTIKTSGGLVTNITEVTTSTYTVLSTDYHISIQYTATGTQTATLSALSAANHGQVYHFKDADYNANANNITIATTGADTIDESATAVIINSGACVTVIGNNTTKNWEIQ